MNAFLLNGRQPERFARLLDERDGGPRRHVLRDKDRELTELLPLVDRLTVSVSPEAGPSPDFKRDLHAMLMATIEREGIGATATGLAEVEKARPMRGREIRLAALLGIATSTLAVSGMGMASGDSNPGDALYGMKRSTEKAQLAIAGTDVSRGQLYLQFARTRMAEATTVAQNPDALAAVLNDMDGETQQGVRLLTSAAMSKRDAAALDSVDSFVTGQRTSVSELLGKIETEDRGRTQTSLTLLEDVQRRSTALRPTLGCLPAGVNSVLDDLGPIPQKCANARRWTAESTPKAVTITRSTQPASPAKPGGTVPSGVPQGGPLGDGIGKIRG